MRQQLLLEKQASKETHFSPRKDALKDSPSILQIEKGPKGLSIHKTLSSSETLVQPTVEPGSPLEKSLTGKYDDHNNDTWAR